MKNLGTEAPAVLHHGARGSQFIKKIIALALTATLLNSTAAPALWAAERATLEGIEVDPDQVTLRLSERVKFNIFATAQPPRLVVELLGTEHGAGIVRAQEGRGKILKKIRSGKYQPEPNLITRVVLDLNKMAIYQAKWSGSDLLIGLVSSPEEAGLQTQGEAQAPEPQEIPPPPVEAPKPVVQAPKPPVETPKQEVMEQAPSVAPVAAKIVPVRKPRAETGLPVKMDSGPSEELSRMALSNDALKTSAPAQQVPRPVKKAAASDSVFGNRERKDIMATLSDEPITLDFDNTDVREILRLLAAKAGINIVYGPDVSGSVTMHLSDVPFREAFTTILSMQGLVTNQVGDNVLRVMTPTTLTKERAVAVNQTRVIRLKYSKADDIKNAIEQVRTAEGRTGKLVSDQATNSLIVTDTIDGIASVERLLGQLDIRPTQVMIEAKLVEVKLNKDLHFGIQWDYFQVEPGKALGKQGLSAIGSGVAITEEPYGLPLDQNGLTLPGNALATGPIGAAGRGTGVSLPASKVFGAFTLGRITNNYILSATLTAAASQGKVKVLSDPKVTTLNGKKASINITTSIPYVTSNVASTGVQTQSVAYVVTGITLDVTPTVNADGRVTLDVNPKVSQPSATASASTTGAPAVDTRDAKTIVLVQDGETIVIGGLITDSVSETVAKVPLLGDIPFIGWLFKKKSVDRTRVELLVFVTTKIVAS